MEHETSRTPGEEVGGGAGKSTGPAPMAGRGPGEFEPEKSAAAAGGAEIEEDSALLASFTAACRLVWDPRHGFAFPPAADTTPEPFRADMIIVRDDSAIVLDPIGRFLRKYNIVLFRSEDHPFTVSDFWLECSRTAFFLADHPEDLKDVAMVVFCADCSQDVIAFAEKEGYFCSRRGEILYLNTLFGIPMEIVLLGDLIGTRANEYALLNLFGKGRKEERIRALKQYQSQFIGEDKQRQADLQMLLEAFIG